MKTLILLRHAKSSWELNVADRNRPLSESGIDRIKRIAKLNASIFENAIIYSSPANRALHTACIMMHKLKIPFDCLRVTESLYTFDSTNVINFIRNLPDELNHVVCVGHNPAFTYTAMVLSNITFDNLPTSGWVKMEFQQDRWSKIQNGIAKLGLPKEILT